MMMFISTSLFNNYKQTRPIAVNSSTVYQLSIACPSCVYLQISTLHKLWFKFTEGFNNDFPSKDDSKTY